jgi:hypothetical protein
MTAPLRGEGVDAFLFREPIGGERDRIRSWVKMDCRKDANNVIPSISIAGSGCIGINGGWRRACELSAFDRPVDGARLERWVSLTSWVSAEGAWGGMAEWTGDGWHADSSTMVDEPRRRGGAVADAGCFAAEWPADESAGDGWVVDCAAGDDAAVGWAAEDAARQASGGSQPC